jgi:hypothetical protein
MKTNHCLRCNQAISGVKHYGQHLECFKKIFSVTEALEFHSLARKESSSKKNQEEKSLPPYLTSYFAGNYKKYEGRLGDSSYILKFSKPEYPELAPVEYLCNKIAYYCKIPVATPFTLIEMEDNETAFVSKNFMHPMKAHASLVHIYRYLEGGSETFNVEKISEAIFQQTKSIEAVSIFLKTILFDALIANGDRHGSNLAIIETAKGKRLAPIYDNPSHLGLESGNMLKAHFSPKGKIWTKASKEPTMIEYLKEMKRLNVFENAQTFLNELSYEKVMGTISEAICITEAMKTALQKLINERYMELKTYVHTRNN